MDLAPGGGGLLARQVRFERMSGSPGHRGAEIVDGGRSGSAGAVGGGVGQSEGPVRAPVSRGLAAWLVAHTSGPASATPVRIAGHRPPTGTPDETTPQPNAHIGANQVIGFKGLRTAPETGRVRAPTVRTACSMTGRQD